MKSKWCERGERTYTLRITQKREEPSNHDPRFTQTTVMSWTDEQIGMVCTKKGELSESVFTQEDQNSLLASRGREKTDRLPMRSTYGCEPVRLASMPSCLLFS